MRFTPPVAVTNTRLGCSSCSRASSTAIDLLAVAELEQVLRGGEPLLGQLVHRRAVRAAPVGEEQHARERGRVDHLRDRVALPGFATVRPRARSGTART